eukprot:CAMPEP_0172166528 /NCGR_PEP_ID=MMETSP1050-20130122/9035_1 /TAXON_ID=233186 /ORGANISM="Cryptomonas curvata, Strain CCAP979/52" /LENGTH=231 /DNA_ID=CAMNT_0012837155 /DNA_START=93 /DNA_END=784 /DNA_ORIENTATION=-
MLKRFMQNREAMKLRWLCAIHNFGLAFFSLAVLLGQLYETVLAAQRIGAYNVFCWQEPTPPNGRLYFWSYLFYLSKYYEFLDTVFIVLKKKPLDFLHCYHHAIVPLSAWMGFKGWYMPIITGSIFNSAVHTVMYYYYGVVTLGGTVWWKRYLTVFQIVQFCSGFGFTLAFYLMYFRDLRLAETPTSVALTFTKGCHADVHAVVFVALVNISFLALFVQFYVRTYSAPRAPR